jgi:predicted nuclease of predicted toxin-antitoxin system
VKVLIDSCVAGSVSPALADAGHDVECVVDWPADPGDAVVLAHAHGSGQVVLTLDKDFGELAVVREQAHSGIVRLVGFTSAEQASASIAVLTRYADELSRGALITAEPGRTRVRPRSS